VQLNLKPQIFIQKTEPQKGIEIPTTGGKIHDLAALLVTDQQPARKLA